MIAPSLSPSGGGQDVSHGRYLTICEAEVWGRCLATSLNLATSQPNPPRLVSRSARRRGADGGAWGGSPGGNSYGNQGGFVPQAAPWVLKGPAPVGPAPQTAVAIFTP